LIREQAEFGGEGRANCFDIIATLGSSPKRAG
jgi:hypothetical protein